MFGVKKESGAEICRGCLSTNRRLTSLADYYLFFTLLNDKQKFEMLQSSSLLLCWECNALLRRMKSFQTQVQHAHKLLEERIDESVSEELVKGLSQLSACHIEQYDVVIENVVDETEEPFINLLKEETKVQTDIFNHNFNPDDNYVIEGTDNFETHTELDLELETTETNLEKTVDIPVKKYKRKIKRVTKKKKFATVTNKNSTRKGLRSSGEIIPPLYQCSKNNGRKKDNNNTKVNNTTKQDFKRSQRKRCLIREDPSEIVGKAKKENKTPDASDMAGNNLQNELKDNNKAEAGLELEIIDREKHIENRREEIQFEMDIDQNKHSNEDESKNDDPDYEEEPEYTFKTKIKRKGTNTCNKWLRLVTMRFDVVNELNEYFTYVDLSPEEVKDILDNELSYTREEQPYGCNYCGICFERNKTLIKHKRNTHKQIAKCTNPVYMMYRCKICDKIIRKEHAEAHMKYLHRRRYYCKECDKDFWDEEEGMSHFKEVHKNLKGHSCDQCRAVTSSKRALEVHVRNKHTPVTCEQCGKTMCGGWSLQMHKRSHESDGSNPEQRYCVSCDKQFVSVHKYQAHVKNSSTHKGKEPMLPCTQCGKLLSGIYSLKCHQDFFHSGKTRYHCPQCDKYFSRKSGLQMHTNKMHLKKKPPKDKLCSICGRGFGTARTLTHHMRTHTGERPHACPHCPAAFAQPYPLRKHLETQHGEAPATKKHKSEVPTTQA